MPSGTSSSSATALGDYLRARRGRLHPGDVGLPDGPGLRRTPGLRREELAALAGVSIDYYIRLEQGKETNPSPAVLEALARALRLEVEDEDHLLALADQAAGRVPRRPSRSPAAERPVVRATVLRLLEQLRPCPAYVLSRTSDVLAANPEGLALFAGIDEWPVERRNTIRYVFEHPAARDVLGDWGKAAAGSAAQLRSLTAGHPHDLALNALIEELEAASPDFAALWKRHEVRARRGEVKTFNHPRVGALTLEFEVLHLGADGQRISVYQAEPGTPDHDAMVLLSLSTNPSADASTEPSADASAGPSSDQSRESAR
ncbi:helix-turn-helix transcriptional regulator [Actinomadura barringtoniae]|uniref:Helix-turn-helix transcriptional regulator n=1 Tax=Actinomadura barringtoniae TaxID=1427535 RepID=A0A939T323_9ACTN|nr:helix-turn-helix transcriptional regulator [Actinomadura barringtoniae]MBO2446064.1 helix-turn-helix transcriptional regulator [Actinomadura barringtoniae]